MAVHISHREVPITGGPQGGAHNSRDCSRMSPGVSTGGAGAKHHKVQPTTVALGDKDALCSRFSIEVSQIDCQSSFA